MKNIFIALVVFICLTQVSCNTENVATSPTVNPVNVYVAGTKDNQACYWKNGQIVMLGSDGFTDAFPRKLVVSNGNVYILGYGKPINNQMQHSIIWRNGVISDIETELNTSNYPTFRIDDMEILGNNEYFVGSYGNELLTETKTAYWKNGVKTIVTDGLTFYNPPTLKVQNDNVFVTFVFNNSTNGYFKNGVFNEIADSIVNGFAANNNDLIVFGSNLTGGFYLNTSTNVSNSITFPENSYITNLAFDNENIYYSTFQEIYKNSTLIFEVVNPVFDNILQFKVLGNNVYNLYNLKVLDVNKQNVNINNTTIQTTEIGEIFNSIFIVQN